MKTKSRGNGQGCAYKRNGSWVAQVVVGYRPPKEEGKQPVPIKKTKGGFPTKASALAYCFEIKNGKKERPKKTLQQVYEEWKAKYAPRIVPGTMKGYHSAYQHFSRLHPLLITAITAADLQECMDRCPAGKRTHQQMKVVAGLLWDYAYDSDYVDKNVTKNLYTGKGKSEQREPITEKELDIIRQAIGKEQYADYVYALCFLGFRPGEFLRLRKLDYHVEDGVSYLFGGSKTDAGKNRKVPIPRAISPIIEHRLAEEGTDLLFPRYSTNRKGEFTGIKQMSDSYFREFIFKPLMSRLGIEGKVPYGARHTYSDKLKKASGDEKAKAAIIGHTDYDFTRKRYQSTDLQDIKTVGDSIK